MSAARANGLLVLTLAQVFVYSRTTDATLFVAALPGILVGAAAEGLRSDATRTTR